MIDLQPISPEDLGWGEIDGAISINAQVVAERLNDLLEMVMEMRTTPCRCDCVNCIRFGVPQAFRP